MSFISLTHQRFALSASTPRQAEPDIINASAGVLALGLEKQGTSASLQLLYINLLADVQVESGQGMLWILFAAGVVES